MADKPLEDVVYYFFRFHINNLLLNFLNVKIIRPFSIHNNAELRLFVAYFH